MPLLYDAAAYDRSHPIGSYWETTVGPETANYPALAQEQSCEVAIIGGGITGLTAALYLARDHQIQTRVLEAGTPAWGASGRNGGFCCVGATSLANGTLVKRFGREQTRRYYREQRQATELVQQLAAEEAIELEAQGEGQIQVAHRPARWQELEAEYEFFREVADYPCQLWSPQKLAELAFRSPEAHGALHVAVGFGLNPMQYTRGLARAAAARGAVIHAQSPVEAWQQEGRVQVLRTPGGTLRANQVILATNGYTEDRLHRSVKGRLLPVLSNILTTRPLTPEELAAQGWRTPTPVYDTRTLLFYYRLLQDGRFLFGGRGGTWGNAAERQQRRRWLTRRLGEMFPAWQQVETTHFWTGLACVSAALTPHVGQFTDDPSLFYALAYHGNGVATGTWSGRAVARLVAGQETVGNLCAVFRQPLRKFPVPALRLWGLRAAYGLARLLD